VSPPDLPLACCGRDGHFERVGALCLDDCAAEAALTTEQDLRLFHWGALQGAAGFCDGFLRETRAAAAGKPRAMFDLDLSGPVARLTLERPEARNAIPLAGWRELAAKMREAEAAGARALVLAGSQAAFCAGADLQDFPALQGDPAAPAGFRAAMREGLDTLAAAAMPTVAAIEGPCYGAGVALALACDLRLAGPGARFAITPAKFGISYPQEDVARLVALVGRGQASRLLLTALPIDGSEAARIGLVEILAGDLQSALAETLAALVAASPASHRVLKRAIALAVRSIAADSAQDESFDALFGAEDFARRFAALRGGR
jgi:enoyl-CoA hydratase/carnithine racemase